MANRPAVEADLLEEAEVLYDEFRRMLADGVVSLTEGLKYQARVGEHVTNLDAYRHQKAIIRTLDRVGLDSEQAKRMLTQIWNDEERGKLVAFPGTEVHDPEAA